MILKECIRVWVALRNFCLRAIVITQMLGSLICVEEFVVSIYIMSLNCVFKLSDYLVCLFSFVNFFSFSKFALEQSDFCLQGGLAQVALFAC